MTATGNVESSGASKNPFMMPPEHELFVLREKERQRLKEVGEGTPVQIYIIAGT